MENKAVAVPSKKRSVSKDPAWLYIFLQDALREAEDVAVMGNRMMGEIGRAVVWTMSAKFDCHQIGVPGQTCRLFERYLSHLTRNGIIGNDQMSIFNYMGPRLMVTIACCFQIATKSTITPYPVGPKEIRTYLASCGSEHSIHEIMDTEREIFRGIGYRVPPYNSVEMAELLAEHLGVEQSALELIAVFVQLAEMRRHDIESEVRLIAGQRLVRYSNPRVRTLDLAAGCVAAAVKKANLEARKNIAARLARMLRVSSCYIKILRDVIIIWTAAESPKPKHRPNILRRQRFADAGHREP